MWPWLLDVWISFSELGTERQTGMAIGPIPGSKIRAYAQDQLGLTRNSEAAERFFVLIRAMDDEFVASSNGSTTKKNAATEIPIGDSAGVVRLFDKIERIKKNQKMRKERTN